MKSSSYFPVVITLAALGLAALLVSNFREADTAPAAGNPEMPGPAQVKSIPGTDTKAVVLTERAAQRLDIQTAPVALGHSLVIPYAAVMYDVDGATWVYVNPEPLVYVRHQIVVNLIAGDQAMLSSGPPVGTTVVTRGAAELFGVEFGVGQ